MESTDIVKNAVPEIVNPNKKPPVVVIYCPSSTLILIIVFPKMITKIILRMWITPRIL